MANNEMSPQLHRTDSDQEILDEMRSQGQRMIKEKLTDFSNGGVPFVNVWMGLSFFAKMIHHQVSFKSPSAILYLACLFLSFLTETEMTFELVVKQFTGRWKMAYLSTILQISAVTALMLFFDTTGTVIVFPLLGLVLVLVSYMFSQMIDPTRDPGFFWQDSRESLNRGFEMSAVVVAFSVAGLSGKVLGYMELEVDVEGFASNLTAGGHGHTAVAPECFLFCSAVFGLLVVLFCTVPPSLSYSGVESMGRVYIPGTAYMSLLFLVVATLLAAEKIIHEYAYLVCCPIIILALLLWLRDAQGSSLPRTNREAERRSLEEERKHQAKLSKYIMAGISPILLAIMAIHSSYGRIGSTVSVSWSWEAFVFSGVCSILSHTVRISILYQMTERKRYGSSRMFWTYGTFLTIITTAVFAAVVIYQYPDEVKNIF